MFMVTDEPINYKQAMKSNENDNWRKAAQEEFRALIKNGTWTLVKRTPDMNVVSSKVDLPKEVNGRWFCRKTQGETGRLRIHTTRRHRLR